ncbi:MAG TPA: molybdopterin-dependent oxidoreductase [Stellaceae bacterium]|nr:molybdopterin-dependent oxidoreductase [Stellaceae bacterium]
MDRLSDPAPVTPCQKEVWYPWPYVEGTPRPKQDGAPLRLVLPWKYGSKSTKSIVRFSFAGARPKTFWSEVGPSEYGFWANVNPAVPHPRWSQATERLIGTDERVSMVIWNGYGAYVAHLYDGLKGEKLFM